MMRMVVLIAAAAAAFAGCGSGIDPKVGPVQAGDEYGYSVRTHCGIEWTQIDGAWWRTDPLNDGNGNPPEGWNNPSQGGRLRIESVDTAVFTGGPEPITFERTEVTDLDDLPEVKFCD